VLVGTDIGGTFTDVVLVHPERGLLTAKSPSTPDDASRGVFDGLGLLADELGVELSDLLAEVRLFIHGTTVATNILVERKGARLGLVTTRGFRDLLELRDGTKRDRYRLRTPFPDALVPRPARCEVRERTLFDGTVAVALDAAETGEALAGLRAAGVEGLVVCFLHAHRNPDHENAVRAVVERSDWRPYVSLSHEALGREGEYDRLSTATVNAYVGPGLDRYLRRLDARLTEAGLRVPMLVMQSSGGVLPAAEAAKRAVGAITSGPAGGAMAGALFARTSGAPLAVTYDMGGTSTDVALIDGGEPLERGRTDVDDLRLAVRAIDIAALGTGGGSIAAVDAGGILDLGPESAGAVPGPACYGRGGTRPTLTDANLVLGYICASTFLGGRMPLSVEASRDAIAAEVARPLGLDVEDAALAVNALANSRVAEGIRRATVRRGLDPRELTLIAFGGAGAIHADAVARELSIPRVLIPREASVLSALGMLAADVRHDFEATIDVPLGELTIEALRAAFERLAAVARERLRASGLGDERTAFRCFLQCRYERQVYSVDVPFDAADLELGDASFLARRFEARYRDLYGHSHDDELAVADVLRVSGRGLLKPVALPDAPPAASQSGRGRRSIRLAGGPVDAPVHWFDALGAGATFGGPAVVDSPSTSIVVLPGSRASVDRHGSLLIEPGAPA
jgi:N-methylhydantoinase A